MLSVLAGYDADDPSSADVAVDDYLGGIEDGVAGLKIGLPTSHFMDGISGELAERFDAAVQVLKNAGAKIIGVDLPAEIRHANALTSMITASEGSALHQHWMETRPDEYGTQTYGRFAGGFLIPASRYIQALNLRTEMLAAFNAHVFEKVDVMMTPMMIVDVPKIAESDLGALLAPSEFLGSSWSEYAERLYQSGLTLVYSICRQTV